MRKKGMIGMSGHLWMLFLFSVLLPGFHAHGFRDDGVLSNNASITADKPGKPDDGQVRKPDAAQISATRLANADGISVEWHPRLGTPVSVRGVNLGTKHTYSGGKGLALLGGGNHRRDAIVVLDNLSRFYGIRDAETEFTVKRSDRDNLGFHHVRLTQTHQGLRVVGGELIVHFDKADQAYEVSGQYIADLQVETTPKVDAEAAVRAAQKDLNALGKPLATLAGTPALVLHARDCEPKLAYELTLAQDDAQAGPGRWRYWIDAMNGAVILKYNDIQKIAAPTSNGRPASITGNILAGEGGPSLNVTGWYENTGYYYLCNTNLHWLVYNVATSGYSDANTYAYRTSAAWSASDRVEMSTARNIDLIQRYYLEVHGLNSFNNAGINARANVHQGTNYVNAYWDGSAFYFGDGDGVVANPLAVLDVCAHEYTHAVDEHTANLVYAGESGALNESFSDVMGTCVEFWAQPDGRSFYPGKSVGTADWLCGEDAWLSSVALRDLRNPANTATVGAGNAQPTRYKGTYWDPMQEVHQNSGVQNFFFYLLSEGGSGNNDGITYGIAGIGITNAQLVACRALTVYCTANTDYPSARGAWISAAMDLNTNWVGSVMAAWSAVGISALNITPSAPVSFRGPVGGPFVPTTQALTLANHGAGTMNWGVASASQAWANVIPGNGVIPAGGSAVLSVTVNSQANSLAAAIYTNTISFTNNADSDILTARAMLMVGQPDNYTELFSAADNDLDYATFTFTPDGSASHYSMCRDVATNFPTDPTGGTTVTLSDDSSAQVTLPGTNTVALYNRRTNVLFIGSNGYLTLDSGDSTYAESFVNHFNRPRICALFDDLNPVSGGTVSWKQTNGLVAVTFSNVREYGTTATVSFQIELFYDGRIRVTYLGVGITDGLAGLSAGGGVPAGFTESDLTSYGPCTPPDGLVVTPNAGLASQGYQGGPFTPLSAAFILGNAGASPLNWSATATQPWLSVSPTNGSLSGSASSSCVVTINSLAGSLAPGFHTDTITFSNLDSGFVQTRSVSLRVLAIPGEIAVLDSIPPVSDLQMPFGDVVAGLSRTGHITVSNTDLTYGLIVSDISFGAFVENFDDGLAQDWVEITDPYWAVVSGEYRAQAGVTDVSMQSVYAAQRWMDCAAQVVMRRTGDTGSAARIVLRATDDFDSPDSLGNAYVFAISGNGIYYVGKYVGGTFSFIQSWTTSPLLNTGTMTNVVLASIQGNNLRMYLNGSLAWSGVDTSITNQGRVGLLAYSGSTPETIHYFDNVTVTDPIASIAAVHPQQLRHNASPLTGGSAEVTPLVPAIEPPTESGDIQMLSLTSGPWRLDNVPTLPLTVPPGGSVTFDIIHQPTAPGSNYAKVVIKSNDADEPSVEVQVTGRGIPDDLRVMPATDFASQGHPGGPFSPSSASYILSNSGPVAISWTTSHTQAWVDVSPSSGTLAVGQAVNVTVGFTAAANTLSVGSYHDVLLFTNQASGAVRRRVVALSVVTPGLAIADAGVLEGNSGTTNILFAVSLTPATLRTVTVAYATTDGTAQAGSDYVATSGILTFAPGQTNNNVIVPVFGDTNAEANETFSITLANPTNALLTRAQAAGTILSDDVGPFFDDFEPDIDRFQWSDFGGSLGSTVLATNHGGYVSGANSLWFGTATNRYATSRPMVTTLGGTVDFWLRIASGTSSTWETADLPGEGIVLEYSVNSGGSWVEFGRYDTSAYTVWTHVIADIPVAAQTGNIQFRWRQLSNSGSGFDHWALDDVAVLTSPRPPTITAQPADRTVTLGGTVAFGVNASGSNPLGYQWRKDGTNLVDTGRISGAVSNRLTIAGVQANDTGLYSVLITNPCGVAISSNATLLVTALDHFAWSAIASPQRVGAPFTATIMARDEFGGVASNFNEAVEISASAGGDSVTNTLLNGLTHADASSSPDYTLGVAFTPNVVLQVTHVRHYSGTKVSIWTDAGALLASQNVVGTPGTWTETPLATPITLAAGARYRVAAYYPAGTNYHYRPIVPAAFANGSLEFACFNSGDAFPSAGLGTNTLYLVDLRYTVKTSVSPTNSGNFVNGVWTGDITVFQPATDLVLVATASSGHQGASTNFDVLLADDLSVTITDRPDPIAVGGCLTNTIIVANSGPTAATGVTATNFLPASAAFVSASASQGSCVLAGGEVRCALGTLAGSASATITVVTTPGMAGQITNRVAVGRAEPDSNAGNNSAASVTTVLMPALSIADASVVEGNSGQSNMVFSVQLAPASPLTVTVNFATADGTASAGSDYGTMTGMLTFLPGQTNQFITVPVNGDFNAEPDETFFVNLSGAVNANLVDAQAAGMITNDDTDSFNPGANSTVYSMALQADGKILVGGYFTALGGQSRSYLGRLNADGTLDTSFNPGANSSVITMAVQADGKILVGGGFTTLGGQSRSCLGRLNADGTLDTSFNPGAGGTVYSMTVQADGKILVGGNFTTLGSQSRSYLGRLNADGTLDTSFNPGAGGTVYSMAVQADGKILVGGNFTTLGGQSRSYLGRFNADGTLDTGFNPGANDYVYSLAVQADGKILVGGYFTTLGGQSRLYLGRLNADGTLDTSFNPGANNYVYSLAVQADGKILLGGGFTTLGGQSRLYLGRLNADGTPDASCNPGASSSVYSLSLQQDGRILVGGNFTSLGGQSRAFLGRLTPTEPATQSLAFDGSTISWQRGGSSPEVGRTSFDISTNGLTWISLGAGTRVAGGWQLSGLTGRTNASLRARGHVVGGMRNGSGWFVETVAGPPVIRYTLSIAGASVLEGDSGTTNMVFAVQLHPPSPQIVTVAFATSNDTALAGSDYTATSGTLTFVPGQTNAVIAVVVQGDTAAESDETFFVNLSSPTNAELAVTRVVGTILSDDGVQVRLFYDSAYVDTTSTTSGEATNVIAALMAKGCQVQTFTGITPASFSNALVRADILYIPELENGDLGAALSAAAKSVISNFIAHGGSMIINGQSASGDENLLNRVFGYGITAASWSGTTVLTNAASGTAFAGGPSSLPQNDGTYEWLRSTLPSGSLSLYQDSSALCTAVALIPHGAGKIVFLAYDWYNAIPRGTQDGGWDEVLRRAIIEATSPVENMEVVSRDDLIASGFRGGPVNPSNKVYTVSNRGTAVLDWSVSCSAEWTPVLTNTSPDAVRSIAIASPQGFRLFRVATTSGPRPMLDTPSYSGGRFQFTLRGQTNATYVIETSAGLQAPAWLTVVPSCGSLPPGASTNVTVLINTNARTLAGGVYSSSVLFNNLMDHATQTRDVQLTIAEPFLHHFTWSMIAPTQQVNVPFPVSLTARDNLGNTATNFAGPVALNGIIGGGLTTNAIMGLPVHDFNSSGNWTLGYAFTPNTNLTVTHLRHYFGTKVSIWTDGGTLLASQNVSNTPGTWAETPLTSPVQLTAGVRYRVASYTGNGSYYCQSGLGTNFPNGTIDQSHETSGDAFPTSSDSVRWWFVDLRYTVGSQTNIPVTPTISGSFTRGIWTGSMAVPGQGAGIQLVADDGSNHLGISTPFTVVPFVPPATVVTVANRAMHLIQAASAQPYPSTILVTNVGAWVDKVTVTLSNLAHAWPNDLDILLVGPRGQKVMLMSDAVGTSTYAFTNLSLTFDNDASLGLPHDGPVASGAYRPTDFDLRDLLPGPAPLGPYGTNLDVFAHTNANGLWSLYIADDYSASEDGFLADGWSLRFNVLLPVMTTSIDGANLVVSWPDSFSCLIESTGSLVPPVTWTPLSPQPPVTRINGKNMVTLPTSRTNCYYHLSPD